MRSIREHRNKAIGIFDSGIGGLTVAAEIFKCLPNEEIIYFGDTGRTPYGPRSPEIVKRFSRQDVNFLIEKSVKFIVVACNTASAVALDYIRGIYNIPMIGVIEPGAAAAAAKTKNRFCPGFFDGFRSPNCSRVLLTAMAVSWAESIRATFGPMTAAIAFFISG